MTLHGDSIDFQFFLFGDYMSLSINRLARQPKEALLFDKKFRRHLESHMGWLRNHPDTREVPIDPHDLYKYEGDFYGLLDAQGIPKKYHWTVMRLNNLYRAGEVPADLTVLLIPEFTHIDRLYQMYKSKNKKTLT